MGVYTLTSFSVPNGLDEVGLDLGLSRLEGESLTDYRQRLLLETRVPAGASFDEFVTSVSRQVGLFDDPVLEIDLILDANGVPLASDPYFEVTSTRVRAYSDYSAGTGGLDFELAIDRASNWFVDDLVTALTASTFFSHTILDTDYQYKLLRDLQYGNSTKLVDVPILRKSFENDLEVRYIKTFIPQAAAVFQVEEATLAAVDTEGDFFIDYTNGVVFTHTLQEGAAVVTHAAFPYVLREAGVRAVPVTDADLQYRTHELAISETGETNEFNNLTPFGGWLVNNVYQVAPTGWGE